MENEVGDALNGLVVAGGFFVVEFCRNRHRNLLQQAGRKPGSHTGMGQVHNHVSKTEPPIT